MRVSSVSIVSDVNPALIWFGPWNAARLDLAVSRYPSKLLPLPHPFFKAADHHHDEHGATEEDDVVP
jgi:hypothetical protein